MGHPVPFRFPPRIRDARCSVVAVGVGVMALMLPGLARSTDGGVDGATVAPTSAEARQHAGEAWDQGERAFQTGDFAAAAEFYESADRLVPSAAAGVGAVRAHRGCHTVAHDARAATIALRLLNRYPTDTRVTAYAYRVTDELAPTLTRMQVRCQGCELTVDDSPSDFNAYLAPGRHTITGTFGQRIIRREVDASPGATVSVVLEAPQPRTDGVPPRTSWVQELSAPGPHANAGTATLVLREST